MNLAATKKIITGILTVLVFVTAGFAQSDDTSFYTINGIVKDARTNNTIAFASVYVPGTSIGTVTNLNGIFTLKVEKSLQADEFAISHLGYRVSSFPIELNLTHGTEFFLEPHSMVLPEVVVRPTDARSVVERAIDMIAQNYPEVPQRLTAFYREAIKQRRDYISISEAVVEVYQTPYTSSAFTDRTRIIQGRKSGDVKKADTLAVKLQGGPHVAMLLDIVKNPDVLISRESLPYYDYEFLDVVQIDDALNYVIGFKPRVVLPYPLYHGKLYISVETMAFTMAEFSLDLSDRSKAAQSLVVRKPLRLRVNPIATNYLITYKEDGGKYYLNYVRSELEFFADWRRRIFRTSYTVMSEMAITKRETEDVVRFPARDSFRPSTILADMVPVYFEDEFWGAYNYIEPEESIESAIQKLNRRIERE
ncbi:MAG: carboxypeptidase-like regulatory domain-containing protein [Bacteroidales bacterium]